MALATVSDVAIPLGRSITTAETPQVQWWLDGVERFIISRLGPIAALNPSDVQYVEAEAVAAKLRRHGNAETSITVAVDDGSVTRRYEQQVNATDITNEWWDLLGGYNTSGTAITAWLA